MQRSTPIRRFMRSPAMRRVQLVIGVILLIFGPIIGGPLPGPGGVIGFAAGLALVLRNSAWARRRYIMFRRRHPKWGHWTEVALRRRPLRQRLKQASEAADAG